jgi:ATP-dependent RNA helicase RhlE
MVHRVEKGHKRKLLAQLIHDGDWQQVLVFTRTKHGANRLSEQLSRDGIEAAAIHGNKGQSARTRALQGFKSGGIRALVATDVAARGLDIDRLPHVVNFELPNVPEDYVHRIGRTGRAGAEGTAVSLVCDEEHKLLRDVEKLLRRKIPVAALPGGFPLAAPRAPEPARDARPRRNPRGPSQRPAEPARQSRSRSARQRRHSAS